MILSLFHCSNNIVTVPKISGNCGYGFYLSKRKEKLFGDIAHRVIVCLKNPLIFNDNEVKGKGFFNMSVEKFNEYTSGGFDSLVWYRNGKLMEVVILSNSCVKSITIVN